MEHPEPIEDDYYQSGDKMNQNEIIATLVLALKAAQGWIRTTYDIEAAAYELCKDTAEKLANDMTYQQIIAALEQAKGGTDEG